MRVIYFLSVIAISFSLAQVSTMTVDERAKEASLLNFESAKLILDGRYNDAYEKLHQAIELVPEFPEAHFNLGVACFNLNKYNEAIDEFIRAEKLGYIRFELYYNVALANLYLDRYDKAEEYAFKAISVSHNSSAFDIILDARLKKGDIDGALKMIDEAQFSPWRIKGFVNNLVNICQNLGSASAQYLRRVYELVVQYNKTYEFLLIIGSIYLSLGDDERALSIFEEAEEIASDSRATMNRVTVLFKHERYNEFIDILGTGDRYKIIENGKGAYLLGYSLFKLGKFDDAEVWFSRALDDGYIKIDCVYSLLLCAQERGDVEGMYRWAKEFSLCADKNDERMKTVEDIIAKVESIKEMGEENVIIKIKKSKDDKEE
ncbi:MAG: tetratricopeptide repeat protein [bacterium]